MLFGPPFRAHMLIALDDNHSILAISSRKILFIECSVCCHGPGLNHSRPLRKDSWKGWGHTCSGRSRWCTRPFRHWGKTGFARSREQTLAIWGHCRLKQSVIGLSVKRPCTVLIIFSCGCASIFWYLKILRRTEKDLTGEKVCNTCTSGRRQETEQGTYLQL
jgi:hypothetical protein